VLGYDELLAGCSEDGTLCQLLSMGILSKKGKSFLDKKEFAHVWKLIDVDVDDRITKGELMRWWRSRTQQRIELRATHTYLRDEGLQDGLPWREEEPGEKVDATAEIAYFESLDKVLAHAEAQSRKAVERLQVPTRREVKIAERSKRTRNRSPPKQRGRSATSPLPTIIEPPPPSPPRTSVVQVMRAVEPALEDPSAAWYHNCTRVLHVPETYVSLAAAVEAAAPSDVIEVAAYGEYRESIYIPMGRRVTIVGTGAAQGLPMPVVRWEGTGPALHVGGDATSGSSQRDVTGTQLRISNISLRLESERPMFPTVLAAGATVLMRECDVACPHGTGVHACDGASLSLERCHLHDCGHDGLASTHWANVRLDGCIVAGNRGHGATAASGSQLTIEASSVTGNSGNGLHVRDPETVLTVEGGEISGNAGDGIHIEEGGAAGIESAAVSANGASGIEVEDAGSVVRCNRSTVDGNREDGVSVVGEGQCRTFRVHAQNNSSCGMVVAGEGSILECHGGTVGGNGQMGLKVTNAGQARVLMVRAERNGEAGIWGEGDATHLHLEGCEVCENKGDGVHLEDGASGELIKVQAGGNRGVGIRIEDAGSSGELTACYATNNKTGVHVWEEAACSLESCVVAENLEFGVRCEGVGTRLTVRASTLSQNGLDGLRVDNGAVAAGSGLEAQNNSRAGVWVNGERSGCTVTGLTLAGNGIDGCRVDEGEVY